MPAVAKAARRGTGRNLTMAGTDNVARLLAFKQAVPGAMFDLSPSLFTATVPGRDEPFQARSLGDLMDKVEEWAAEETMSALLFGRQRGPEGMPPS